MQVKAEECQVVAGVIKIHLHVLRVGQDMGKAVAEAEVGFARRNSRMVKCLWRGSDD